MISNVILSVVMVILILVWLEVRFEDAEKDAEKKEYQKIIWVSGKIMWFINLVEDQNRRKVLVKLAKNYLSGELWIGNCTSREVRVKLESFLRGI